MNSFAALVQFFFTTASRQVFTGLRRLFRLGLQNRSKELNKSGRDAQARTVAQAGFTIVELLIVVVVIAILAAVTVVAYNGVSNRAKESALKTDLQNGLTQLHIAKTTNGEYPANTDALKRSDSTTFTYTSDADSFCLAATSDQLVDKSFYVTEGGTVQEGECPEPPMATTMQTLTSSQCSTLTTYTGSNEEAIITLTDNRGGTEQTYQVAKLADDNCWMLNNLKLGSTSGTITLTPSDSNIASDFTLPQVAIPGATDYDNPQVVGPVPGDTGSGATNYGYRYNWSAATAGQSRTTMPAGSGNATHSICPAGWRLPIGGTTGEFAWLNAKMNDPSASAPSTSTGTGFYQNWQYTGPFKGVAGANWIGSSFNAIGSNTYLWSRTARSSNDTHAHYLHFNLNLVDSGNTATFNRPRYDGLTVRCLFN